MVILYDCFSFFVRNTNTFGERVTIETSDVVISALYKLHNPFKHSLQFYEIFWPSMLYSHYIKQYRRFSIQSSLVYFGSFRFARSVLVDFSLIQFILIQFNSSWFSSFEGWIKFSIKIYTTLNFLINIASLRFQIL